jgi:serine/threonine-protein kinase HipA
MSVRLPTELTVLMHGTVVGTLRRRDRRRPLLLQYRDTLAPSATPLSVSMPTVVQRHHDARVRHWIAGLLPDRSEILAAWRRTFGVTSLEEYALLPHIGLDVAGAVQFCHPDRLAVVEDDGALVPLTDADLSRLLTDLTDTATGWGVQAHTGQFSLAGAQAKVALRRTADGWARASGSHPTTHILKPAIVGMADQDLGEHLTMRTARNLGLPIPGTQVRTFQGVRALIVQRYDRRTVGGRVHRVHQEDLVQALGRPPSDKYEASGGPGIVDLVGLLRRVVSPREQIDNDILRFLDAAAFNYLTGGTDAHAKNFSLLLAGAQVRLAPLYDLNSFLPYNGSRTYVELAMSIGPTRHTRTTDITAEDWRWLARRVQIDPDRLVARVAGMAEALPDAARSAAKDPDIDDPTAGTAAFGHRFVDAIAAHARRCAARLQS